MFPLVCSSRAISVDCYTAGAVSIESITKNPLSDDLKKKVLEAIQLILQTDYSFSKNVSQEKFHQEQLARIEIIFRNYVFKNIQTEPLVSTINREKKIFADPFQKATFRVPDSVLTSLMRGSEENWMSVEEEAALVKCDFTDPLFQKKEDVRNGSLYLFKKGDIGIRSFALHQIYLAAVLDMKGEVHNLKSDGAVDILWKLCSDFFGRKEIALMAQGLDEIQSYFFIVEIEGDVDTLLKEEMSIIQRISDVYQEFFTQKIDGALRVAILPPHLLFCLLSSLKGLTPLRPRVVLHYSDHEDFKSLTHRPVMIPVEGIERPSEVHGFVVKSPLDILFHDNFHLLMEACNPHHVLWKKLAQKIEQEFPLIAESFVDGEFIYYLESYSNKYMNHAVAFWMTIVEFVSDIRFPNNDARFIEILEDFYEENLPLFRYHQIYEADQMREIQQALIEEWDLSDLRQDILERIIKMLNGRKSKRSRLSPQDALSEA